MENRRKHFLAAPDLHVFLCAYCTPQHLLLKPSTFFHESFNPSMETTSITFVDHAAMEFSAASSSGSIFSAPVPQFSGPSTPIYATALLVTSTVIVHLKNLMGCEFVQLYGLTETTGGGTFLSPADHDPARGKLRSCGAPDPR